MKKPTVTAQRLRQQLLYQPKEGLFFWRDKAQKRVRTGVIAGNQRDTYRDIGIDGTRYAAHRLAWLYMTGEWPELCVVGKNGNLSDLRWSNLTLKTRCQVQRRQTKAHTNSLLGVIGVSPFRGRFVARISVNKKRRSLGVFDTIEDASKAYWAEKKAALLT